MPRNFKDFKPGEGEILRRWADRPWASEQGDVAVGEMLQQFDIGNHDGQVDGHERRELISYAQRYIAWLDEQDGESDGNGSNRTGENLTLWGHLAAWWASRKAASAAKESGNKGKAPAKPSSTSGRKAGWLVMPILLAGAMGFGAGWHIMSEQVTTEACIELAEGDDAKAKEIVDGIAAARKGQLQLFDACTLGAGECADPWICTTKASAPNQPMCLVKPGETCSVNPDCPSTLNCELWGDGVKRCGPDPSAKQNGNQGNGNQQNGGNGAPRGSQNPPPLVIEVPLTDGLQLNWMSDERAGEQDDKLIRDALD